MILKRTPGLAMNRLLFLSLTLALSLASATKEPLPEELARLIQLPAEELAQSEADASLAAFCQATRAELLELVGQGVKKVKAFILLANAYSKIKAIEQEARSQAEAMVAQHSASTKHVDLTSLVTRLRRETSEAEVGQKKTETVAQARSEQLESACVELCPEAHKLWEATRERWVEHKRANPNSAQVPLQQAGCASVKRLADFRAGCERFVDRHPYFCPRTGPLIRA